MSSGALQLLISIFLVLLISLPLMSWVIGREYKEPSARVWFTAIALDSIVVLLTGFKTLIGESLSEVLSQSLVALIYLLLGAALNLERRDEPVPAKKIASFVMMFALIQSFLIWLDPTKFYAAIWINLVYIIISIYLIKLTIALVRETTNTNLKFILVGWLIGLSGYLWRIYETINLGERILIFSLAPVSNWIIISSILTVILLSYGYLGYMQDKLVRSKLELAVKAKHAEVQRQLALAHAEELEEIVKQRDHMVIVNSRFQAIGGLTLFNSAIIHEITQPLSGLTLTLQSLANQVSNGSQILRETVSRSIEMNDEIVHIVSTLRGLIQQGSIESQRIDAKFVINAILPVIRTECQLKNIELVTSIMPGSVHFEANTSLLQRVILNLVSNALDAMDKTVDPRLNIETDVEQFDDATFLVIRIQDNGKGMSDEQISCLFRPFASSKQDGTGVGLALSQILVMRWGGEIVATRANSKNDTGMLFEIRLPATVPSRVTE